MSYSAYIHVTLTFQFVINVTIAVFVWLSPNKEATTCVLLDSSFGHFHWHKPFCTL